MATEEKMPVETVTVVDAKDVGCARVRRVGPRGALVLS